MDNKDLNVDNKYLKLLLDKHMSSAEVKRHYRWKAALCQHPMYMLIDEDRGVPKVTERIGPWGADNADEYIKRVERNLDSIDLHDDVKLNYEFSAYELMRMCKAYPHVYARIKEAIKKGKLGFVNGTYAQPHLQILGSESNWRQFEKGLRIYKDLFGVDIRLYAMQETAVHKQISQLVRCFGYEMIAIPAFPAVLETISGGFTLLSDGFTGRNYYLPRQESFVHAMSLDGTSLPLYVGVNNTELQSDIIYHIGVDLPDSPRLWTRYPDMCEVSEKYYQELTSVFDLVIMEDELKIMLKESPPQTKAWLYSFSAYADGVWAEELLRSARDAEAAALAAEAVMCINQLKTGQKADERLIDSWWDKILAYQHHDVYWTEVTDLRRQGINANLAVKKACDEEIRRISESLISSDANYISILNWLPAARRTEIRTTQNFTGATTQVYGEKVFGFCDLPPSGFKALAITGEKAAASVKTPLPPVVKIGEHEGILDSAGLLKNIRGIAPALDTDTLIGEIRCLIGKQTYTNRSAEIEFFDGPVASILTRKSSLKDIPLRETYYFYKNEGHIKAEITFDFNASEAGRYWNTDTKLNILIPTSGENIQHDIPFGYTDGKADFPLFAINWLHCGGLVYANGGTVRHTVQNGIIVNTVAWGGNVFFGGHPDWMIKGQQFDIRLYGTHTITYHLFPVASPSRFDGTAIARRVTDLTTPIHIVNGRSDDSFLSLDRNAIETTSLYARNGSIYARGVKLPTHPAGTGDFAILNQKIR
ncbi:MAG: hypothetical protein FWD61_04095 [Phycisphaerales bacterium]|nr:hypothetical protein [Phycisphaerales bacterium]